jgi:hypothetical protein
VFGYQQDSELKDQSSFQDSSSSRLLIREETALALDYLGFIVLQTSVGLSIILL